MNCVWEAERRLRLDLSVSRAWLYLRISSCASGWAVAPLVLVLSVELFLSVKRPWEELKWVGDGHP